MNVSVSTTRSEVPECFGKEWDKNAAECAGGPDQNFTHPKSGLHVREQCSFFQSCGSRTQAKSLTQGVIPPQQLVRPPQPPQPQAQPQTFADFMRAKNAEWAEQQRVSAMQAPRPSAPVVPQQQQQQQHVPVMHTAVNRPASVYQLNYEMPGYLTTPEPRMDGETLWPVLMREVIRSMLKALGHSVSHFFDARAFREKEK